MMGNLDPPWLNYDEAMEIVTEFKDVGLEQFVLRGLRIVVADALNGQGPSTPIDLVYVVKMLTKLFDQKAALLRILNGEDLRWWGDDEFE